MGENSTEKGKRNREMVLLWTFRHGFVSEEVLQALLQVKRRPARELVERRVLRKISPPPGFLRAAYALHPAVLDEARSLFRTWSGGLDLPYKSRFSISFIQKFRHTEATQLKAIEVIRASGESIDTPSYRNEREIPPALAIPDFLFCRYDPETDTESTEWYEIELNGKKDEKLIYQQQARAYALRDGQFSKLIWYYQDPWVKDKIEGILTKKSLPHVERNGSNFYRSAEIEGWSPAALLRATEFRRLPPE